MRAGLFTSDELAIPPGASRRHRPVSYYLAFIYTVQMKKRYYVTVPGLDCFRRCAGAIRHRAAPRASHARLPTSSVVAAAKHHYGQRGRDGLLDLLHTRCQ